MCTIVDIVPVYRRLFILPDFVVEHAILYSESTEFGLQLFAWIILQYNKQSQV